MLAGPGGASRWVNEDIDALPYADELPEGWRADVDRLVQEEMRRMKKRPKDYLEEMPPAREIDWSGCPLLEKAFARVAEGKGGLDRPDGARYESAPPPKNKRNDEKAWEVAVKNARAQLEHQTLRVQNLELAAKPSEPRVRARAQRPPRKRARLPWPCGARRGAPPYERNDETLLYDHRRVPRPRRRDEGNPKPRARHVLGRVRAHGSGRGRARTFESPRPTPPRKFVGEFDNDEAVRRR